MRMCSTLELENLLVRNSYESFDTELVKVSLSVRKLCYKNERLHITSQFYIFNASVNKLQSMIQSCSQPHLWQAKNNSL